MPRREVFSISLLFVLLFVSIPIGVDTVQSESKNQNIVLDDHSIVSDVTAGPNLDFKYNSLKLNSE